jgi:thiol-disulfide isomerase/thioredoxin
MTTPHPEAPQDRPTPSLLRFLIPVGILLVLIVGSLTWIRSSITKRSANSGASTVSADELHEGLSLPDFELPAFPQGSVKVSSLKHKVTLVNFWATWCEACMVEIPSMLKLRAEYQNQGFGIVFINVDENPASVLPKTLPKMGIDFQIYTDTEQKLADLFQVHAIPLSVILDQNRKILMIESGERNWNSAEIKEKIQGWLKN